MLEYLKDVMDRAKESGLQNEVMVTALREAYAMGADDRGHDNYTRDTSVMIQQALENALLEWDI